MHEIDEQVRQQAEQKLDYRFTNPALLAEALTHASIASERLQSNERLEFLGDALLGAAVCEHLFHEYPDYLEGELTKIKSAVVSRRVCARIADRLGLTELMSMGKGMMGRQKPHSLAAAVYEALVAAIYLDGGWAPTRRFIIEHMRSHIEEAAASAHQRNFKSVLQQYCQKRMEQLPVYRLLEERGPDHSKAFEVCAEIEGRRFTPAWGGSKKQAEQEAARVALKEMGLLAPDEQGRLVLAEDGIID